MGRWCARARSAQWAFRGFNPHHRKDKSYYPLLAHVAQTGQILRLKNRPGNVHDTKRRARLLAPGADRALRQRFGRAMALECRMDAAFFQRGILQLLAARDASTPSRCAFSSLVGLRPLVAARAWKPLPRGLSYFEAWSIRMWGPGLRVVIYRKRVRIARARTSSSTCSRPMTATTSTRPSRPTELSGPAL